MKAKLRNVNTVPFISLTIIFVILVGCGPAYTPSPYQPFSSSEGYIRETGYEDRHLKDNVYVVSFQGSPSTSTAIVAEYAYRRAAEVCEQNGYRDFKVLHETESAQGSVSGGKYPIVTLRVGCIK
ncbi:MAG: CC0125/CC1285 family lipoprotein [Planctomycetota bacterium]